MVTGLAIHRLSARTPARAEAVAARLALQALGADLEDALPRGLPPQSLLWLRRLRLQAPKAALLRPAPVAWRQDWVAAGRERLDAALARAARPALGPVAEDVEAVLFADEAEMLACLALAARAGQLDRWWWRGLLGRTWPHWQVAWAARPQAQMAAQRLLQRAGWGSVAAFDVGPANETVERPVVPVASAAMLDVLEPVIGLAQEDAVAGLTTKTLPAAVVNERAPVRASAAPPVVGDLSLTGPPQAREVTEATSLRPPSVQSTRLHPALPVERALPARVLPTVSAEPATNTPAAPSPPTSAPGFVRQVRLVQPGESRAHGAGLPAVGEVEVRRGVQRTVTPRPAAPSAPEPGSAPLAVSPPPAPTAPPATVPRPTATHEPSRRTPHTATHIPLAAASDSKPESVAADAAWPWPEALLSRQAPLLFLVNALLEDGLYPDFTRPRDPGLQVPLWALLAALAQAWRLPPDPLHAALVEHAGDWAPPGLMPPAPGVPAGGWHDWLPAYARTLRHRLCRRLGLRTAQWPRALTLAHPAQLWLSEAEWVVQFDLGGHDVAWRLAGLDRDPGWLPSTGVSLRFEFC